MSKESRGKSERDFKLPTYLERERERQRERETDRHRERDTERERESDRDTERESLFSPVGSQPRLVQLLGLFPGSGVARHDPAPRLTI